MKEAIKYVYDSKDRKYGIAIAILMEDQLPMVGLARCNLKADNFNKKKAVELARARAIKWGIVKFSGRNMDKSELTQQVEETPFFSYSSITNPHIEGYLDKFSNHHEEFKFMKAIDYVLNRVLTRKK